MVRIRMALRTYAALCVAVSLVLPVQAHASITAAGKLDRTFSGNGKVSVAIGQPNDEAYALAVQPDGNILLVGVANAGVSGTDLGLVRFHPDGTKDQSFGRHGIVQTDLGGDEAAFDVALQPDGRSVVVGWNPHDMIVVRYRHDGRLDPSFGHDGVVTVDIDVYDPGAAVTVAPDGGILVAGFASDGTSARSVLARFLPDGSRDAMFGRRGLVIGRRDDRFIPQDLALQPDGRIVVTGVRYPPGDVKVRRYLPDGHRDASFGSRGKVVTPLFRSTRAAVAIRPDGDIVVTGTLLGDRSDFGVAALRPDGSLDTTFGSDGTSGVDFGGTSDQAAAVAVAADGSVILGGDAIDGGRLFALARLLPDGTLDASFGHDGRVTTGGGELGFVQDLTLDADGRIVVAGVASPRGNLRFMALRFLGA